MVFSRLRKEPSELNGPPSIDAGPALFQHAPLDHSTRSIRLLRVLPGLSDVIRCKVFHTTIEAPYQCLSYCWGKENPKNTILLNDASFEVRQNLFDFLSLWRQGTGLLPPDHTTYLWVDALCINQDDIQERNHQVALMGSIFRGATIVNIWLGKCPKLHSEVKSDALSDFAMACGFTQVSGQASIFLAHVVKEYENTESRLWNEDTESHLIRKPVANIEDKFLGNQYWRRAWVIQEIYVAKEVVIFFYDERFRLETCLSVFLRRLDLTKIKRPEVTTFLRYFGYSGHGQSPIPLGGTSDNLLALLRQFPNKECSIPRDRLYSLLSLYRRGNEIVVDYAQSDASLLRDVVEHVRSTTQRKFGLCSLAQLVRLLSPSSDDLGSTFIEFECRIPSMAVQSCTQHASKSSAYEDDSEAVPVCDVKPLIQNIEPVDLEYLIRVASIQPDYPALLEAFGNIAADVVVKDTDVAGSEEELHSRSASPRLRAGALPDATVLVSKAYGNGLCLRASTSSNVFDRLRVSIRLIWEALERMDQSSLHLSRHINCHESNQTCCNIHVEDDKWCSEVKDKDNVTLECEDGNLSHQKQR